MTGSQRVYCFAVVTMSAATYSKTAEKSGAAATRFGQVGFHEQRVGPHQDRHEKIQRVEMLKGVLFQLFQLVPVQ